MKILIKNGSVWDGEGFLAADVLTDGPTVTRIAPGISCADAWEFDARGMTVSAGLVDCHVHMLGLSGPEYSTVPEATCFPFGVTAAIDAGSRLGDKTFAQTIAVKNVLFTASAIENNHLNREVTAQRLAKYGDRSIGIKMFFDETSRHVEDITPLLEVCAFAREHNTRVLVHCNHSPTPMLDIVKVLRAGDVLTHIYHGGKHTCLEEDFAAFQLAREKGITLDAGFAGFVHTDFAVLRRAIEAGWLPDTISTDLSCNSAFKRGGRYGLTMTMSMARAAGMEEEDIFRCVTTAPAQAHGQSWGRLTEGGPADIAVLAYTNEGFSLTDKAGNTLESPLGYRCKLTISDGMAVYRD